MIQSGISAPMDALVVGAGPVGLTMAAELVRHGVGCRIIDRAVQPSDKSKALVVWPRTLELLADMGCADRFLRHGLMLDHAVLYADGRRLFRAGFPPRDTAFTGPLMIPQCDTEKELAAHLDSLGVQPERSVELTAFSDVGDAVEATLRHVDGREEKVRCSWLLGCDGAHSSVRRQLNVPFAGEFEPNDWVLIDCFVRGPIARDAVSTFMHARGVIAFFPFGEGRFRLIADVGKSPGTERPAAPTLEQAQALVDERGPGGLYLHDPVWLSGFRIHERKVADYRKGRCFLAGDAAHIHSPAGGQGMNTGMQDAYNLAWKLGLAHRGLARPELLDSYSMEREAEGRAVLKRAGNLTRMATLRNPLARFLRNRVAMLLGRFAAFRDQFTYNLTQLRVAYPSSPMNADDPGPGWKKGVRPGERLPDVVLKCAATGRAKRTHELVTGTQWSVILLSEPEEANAMAGIAAQLEAEFAGLATVHRVIAAEALAADVDLQGLWLDSKRELCRRLGVRATSGCILVRPDKYIGYRGQPASVESVRRYLNRFHQIAIAVPARG